MSTTSDLTQLKEAIVLVSELSDEDKRFGAVKLNKILYFADFKAYRELGRSITGATYQHLPEGPAPRQLLQARHELVQEGAIEIVYRPVFNYVQQRTVAKRSANTEVFSDPAEDKKYLEEAVEFLRDVWGYQASEMSHREWGFKLTHDGEDIPYRTAWLSADEPTQEQRETARGFFEEKWVDASLVDG